MSEIPAARLRALNVALAASTQWLFNFVVAKSVPTSEFDFPFRILFRAVLYNEMGKSYRIFG